MTAIATLYKWFSDLKKPNGAQFKALIDSFWHKSEKISMNTIDGLDRIIEGTASAQQLQNHLTDTHAHKGLFDGKVDKVEGKGLSSNDFTNTYKQQLDTLEDYDIELDESTTELKFKKGNNVVRRIPLMFLDDEGTKLVYNRTSKTLELRDKRDNLLTSIPVSHFVSNIPTDIVVQNGKIKLMSGSEIIGENTISYNDLADKPELNYLPLTGGTVTGDVNFNGDFLLFKDKTKIHVRNNGNIVFGNKPFNDLVIGEFKGVQLWGQGNDRVVLAGGGVTNLSELKNENIKVGGRNLLRNSGRKITNSDYLIARYKLTDKTLKEGETVTLTIKGQLGAGKQSFLIHNSNGYVHLTNLENKGNGIYQSTFNWTSTGYGYTADNTTIDVYTAIHTVIVDSTIEWIKLERGNHATDWTPAPEDLESEIPQYKTITDAHTFLDKDGSIHFGSGSGVANAPNSSFYEMVGFTHSSKNWGFIIAKNIDVDDKRLYIKQVIGGTYKEWFTLEDRSSERTINVTDSTFNITPDIVGKTLHINNNCTVNYNTMPLLTTVAIRKVFDGGEVKFTGSVEAIYTGDRVLNGKKGSTAIIDYSSDNTMVFVDIRNI